MQITLSSARDCAIQKPNSRVKLPVKDCLKDNFKDGRYSQVATADGS